MEIVIEAGIVIEPPESWPPKDHISHTISAHPHSFLVTATCGRIEKHFGLAIIAATRRQPNGYFLVKALAYLACINNIMMPRK